MNTWRIHIKGQIQGVGFRPFIYRLANKKGLNGWVCNSTDGVHIEFNGNEGTAKIFIEKILSQSPKLAKITWHQLYEIDKQEFVDFQIVESTCTEEPNLLLTPDFGLCEKCRVELSDVENRRCNYPFITCTDCGPRFSIVQSLPYDRPHTSMSVFDMCTTCRVEYHHVENRRYFSQTNSCSSCGISLTLFDNNKNIISNNYIEIIQKVLDSWESGKLIAIKGVGGYLLTCHAGNEVAINKLRQLKHRPTKPFALMFPNAEMLNSEFNLSNDELNYLQSQVAPIVIVDNKHQANAEGKPRILCEHATAPNLNQLGVMLPYTPLFELLLTKFERPIIATSANISNSPIVFQEEKALDELSTIADLILTNNQKIVIPQDDSVIRFSYFNKQRIILRRSRGLAPNYINEELSKPANTVFAAGAMLKSTFTFLHQGNVFISQYLGDLESFDTQENYRHTAHHFFNLFNSKPELVLCDAHPDYTSSQFAQQLAKKRQLSVIKIQHHLAHFSALLGEHNLIHTKTPILGVIWDGTGLGDDGNIWGGEFFTYDNYQFERRAHLEYFDFILGNKMPKEPRLSALSVCRNSSAGLLLLKEKFSNEEWNIYNNILSKQSRLMTSSVGRLFDAVASMLDLCDQQSFEGEAAMLLENAALSFFMANDLTYFEIPYPMSFVDNRIGFQEANEAIIQDLRNGKPRGFIAAKFHFSLVKGIEMVAKCSNSLKIAFSGGVFQNGLLVDLLIDILGSDFELFFHQELSPNDENISFGQLVYYQIEQLSAGK